MGLFWGTNFTSFLGDFEVANERGESEKWGRPACPSSKSSHFQNEAMCKTSVMKVSFWMGPKNDFHINSLGQLGDGILLKHVWSS